MKDPQECMKDMRAIADEEISMSPDNKPGGNDCKLCLLHIVDMGAIYGWVEWPVEEGDTTFRVWFPMARDEHTGGGLANISQIALAYNTFIDIDKVHIVALFRLRPDHPLQDRLHQIRKDFIEYIEKDFETIKEEQVEEFEKAQAQQQMHARAARIIKGDDE